MPTPVVHGFAGSPTLPRLLAAAVQQKSARLRCVRCLTLSDVSVHRADNSFRLQRTHLTLTSDQGVIPAGDVAVI
jgi:hypothetical protein